jgi:hypothetical protein
MPIFLVPLLLGSACVDRLNFNALGAWRTPLQRRFLLPGRHLRLRGLSMSFRVAERIFGHPLSFARRFLSIPPLY